MKTRTTITQLTKDDLVNLFSTALYDSNYLVATYDTSVKHDADDSCEDIIANILLSGGAVKITDYYAEGVLYGDNVCELDEEENGVYTIYYADVLSGLEKAVNGLFNAGKNTRYSPDFKERMKAFAKRSFNAFDWNEQDWDATTADCLMQIILFNEIIYG